MESAEASRTTSTILKTFKMLRSTQTKLAANGPTNTAQNLGFTKHQTMSSQCDLLKSIYHSGLTTANVFSVEKFQLTTLKLQTSTTVASTSKVKTFSLQMRVRTHGSGLACAWSRIQKSNLRCKLATSTALIVVTVLTSTLQHKTNQLLSHKFKVKSPMPLRRGLNQLNLNANNLNPYMKLVKMQY